MSAAQIMDEIGSAAVYIRGLTVSGGECTLYPAFLRELGALVHKKALTFFLDSNGSYDFGSDPGLLSVTDGVMLDIKASAGEYVDVTGRGAAYIHDRAAFLAERGKLWEIRTVVSPGLFDAAKTVREICMRLSRTASPPRYRLIRYRPIGVRNDAAARLEEPDDALMNELAGICGSFGIKSVIT
jgi:pyruvate formate lyase activating enzyme